MRVRSAAAPRRVRATGPAAAVAAAAPCAALLDGVRASVVGVVVACAGPLAPALRLVSQRFNSAAVSLRVCCCDVLSLQQCAEHLLSSLGSKRCKEGLQPLRRQVYICKC